MSSSSSTDAKAAGGRALLVAGILLVAFNLRASMAAVGPLADAIRESLGLSSGAVGLLTTLPLLAFGVFAVVAPALTRRLGAAATLALAMVMLATGVAVRSVPAAAALFGGTLLLGVGIALANVLMPALVKQHFTRGYGPMTALYSGMMSVGASLAAGLSVPMAARLGGWEASLGAWAATAVLALLVWLPQCFRLTRPAPGATGARRLPWASRLGWMVALYMGLQSVTFYVFLAWLPDMLRARGAMPEAAGWLLSLSQVASAVGAVVIPLWAPRLRDQRPLVKLMVGVELVSLVGLASSRLGPAWVWVGLLGLTLGGAFSLSLYFIGVRARDAASATSLSGMVQAVGYLVAAVGPFVAGGLFDVSGAWLTTLGLLGAIAFVKLYVGTQSGREGFVEAG